MNNQKLELTKDKEEELSRKIQELKESDYSYEQIAVMLNVSLGRVMGFQ